MQNDRLQVVTKLGEGVKGCRRTAKTIKRAANLRRKTVDVLRTVTIFNMMAAAFANDWLQVRNRAASAQRRRVLVMVCLVRSIISWTEEVPVVDSDLFEKGLKMRKQVLGEKYVDANLAGSDEFMMTFQRAVTELAWGYAWSRPGLDQKARSLLTLGILGGLGRFQELGIYVNAALASGVTVDEIREALVQITVYCGTPAGRQAFLAAHDALKPSKQ
jgi:4-carboxymuconolactone decarboxylase